ncbi:MAG: carboxynorspermidine decarboxylase, partial [Pseudomonadota bacterium]|nr:carboxynorspermidine decarboxylase [Pseudomonadota bacterium]
MMMATQSAGAGRFADFDLSRVPSPCFVIDEVKLAENLGILKSLGTAANVNILLALKAFSMWELAPLISAHLDGCCASGLWEAKLAHDRFGGHISTHAPAFKPAEIDEIARLSSHVIVNTPQQAVRFGA